MNSPILNKLAFAGLGGLVALVIAVPVAYKLAYSGFTLNTVTPNSNATAVAIKNLGNNAFGSLVAPAPETVSAVPGVGSAPVTAVEPAIISDVQIGGMGGGLYGGTKMADATSIAIGEPYPNPIQYTYTYAGEPLNVSEISDTVYRQNKQFSLPSGSGNALANATVGPVDLGSFSEANLQSFSLVQANPNGYSLYVDPTYGTISINGNTGLWGTYNPTQLTEDQLVADDETIRMAQDFITAHNIDTSAYGTPSVDNRGLMYALSQPVSQRYIPDTKNVAFPLIVDGQPVYDESGTAYGMVFVVSMRTKTVVSAYINVAGGYETSSYSLERDTDTLLKLVSQGGIYNNYTDPNATQVNVEVGTPDVILVTHYSWSESGQQTLLVPALRFPVTNSPTDYPLYQSSVIIPLPEEIIENANTGVGQPIPLDDMVRGE